MAHYIQNLEALQTYIQGLRDRLGRESFSHNKDGDFLPRVGQLMKHLVAQKNSLLNRIGQQINHPPANEADGDKQFERLKKELFSTIETMANAEQRDKPFFRNPFSSKAKNQPLVDFLKGDLRAFKRELDSAQRKESKP